MAFITSLGTIGVDLALVHVTTLDAGEKLGSARMITLLGHDEVEN